MYGLAGFRIGFSVSNSEASDYINRIRATFAVSNAPRAAAIGSLEDEAFREFNFAVNPSGLSRLARGFDEMFISHIT
jgi:histidinol-phosphate aminotransferase